MTSAKELYQRIQPQLLQNERGRVETSLKYLQAVASKDSLILDLGAGQGKITELISGYRLNTIASDISLENCRLISKKGIISVVSDAQKTPFKSGVFDVVYSTEIIEHLYDVDS
jgi:2-polyprenyl-3-methyl-5-hydroxy-6-metoxy-1,4-benzoquinol methylase